MSYINSNEETTFFLAIFSFYNKNSKENKKKAVSPFADVSFLKTIILTRGMVNGLCYPGVTSVKMAVIHFFSFLFSDSKNR